MVILSLSGNIPVFITWLINGINYLMMAGLLVSTVLKKYHHNHNCFCWKAFYCFLYSFFIYILKSENRINCFFK